MQKFAALALSFVALVAAQTVIIINVGGNTDGDATKVFQPASITANQGDVVYFNCEYW
jgi:hypothetical protein